jgi:hypothetical protein
MAVITVKDLSQSDELDREAMQSITGGARIGVRPAQIDQAMAGSGRIVDYPPGFGPLMSKFWAGRFIWPAKSLVP